MPHSPTSVTVMHFSDSISPDHKLELMNTEERKGNEKGRNNNKWEEDLQLGCSIYESNFNGHADPEEDDDDNSFSTFNDNTDVDEDDDDDQTLVYDDISFDGSTVSKIQQHKKHDDGDEEDDMFIVSNNIIGDALLSNSSDEGNIFILLLDPVEKIFEVILVSYLRDKTTLGDLLRVIVFRAKEPSLGFQQYVGFCKLRDKTELLEIDVLVHSTIVGTDGSTNCAKMVDGDMLIAIPKGYDGKEMLKLGERVLQNAQVRKVVQKCVEIDESNTAATIRRIEKSGRQQTSPSPTKGRSKVVSKSNKNLFPEHSANVGLSSSCRGDDESSASASVPSSMPLSLLNTAEESDMMSSWSKSFERSFISGTHNVKTLRKKCAAKQSKVRKTCSQVATIAVSYTIGSYLCNSEGYFTKATRDNNTAFGVLGAVQCFCILSALMKYQLQSNYGESKNGSAYDSFR